MRYILPPVSSRHSELENCHCLYELYLFLTLNITYFLGSLESCLPASVRMKPPAPVPPWTENKNIWHDPSHNHVCDLYISQAKNYGPIEYMEARLG